jgi:hypothetical protein
VSPDRSHEQPSLNRAELREPVELPRAHSDLDPLPQHAVLVRGVPRVGDRHAQTSDCVAHGAGLERQPLPLGLIGELVVTGSRCSSLPHVQERDRK